MPQRDHKTLWLDSNSVLHQLPSGLRFKLKLKKCALAVALEEDAFLRLVIQCRRHAHPFIIIT